MAKWGSPWGFGFPWGMGPTGADWACDLARSRVLVQHPDDGLNTASQMDFHDYVCVMAQQAGEFLDTANQVKTAFKLDTAVGVQLDVIGAIVGLPRSGYPDDTYRNWLGIQIDLLVSAAPGNPNWTGTHNNILRIVRRFIGDSVVDPVVLHNLPPYSYKLTVPGGLNLVETKTLTKFLCRATWAGVLGQIIYLMDNLTYCYVVQADTLTAGTYCYVTQADTPGSAVYDHVVLIGADNC
jgi:hypothetical protein